MMKLWNSPARILYNKTVSQLISVHRRNTSKKCPDNKGMNFILYTFLYINQLVGIHQHTLKTYYKGVSIIIIMEPTGLIFSLLGTQRTTDKYSRRK